MFEKETKFIYDLSMNHVKQLGSYMTFDQLAAGSLHPAVIKYISAEIDYLLYEDRQRLLASSNFDYSGEEINKYFSLIGREVKKNRKFSLDYIGDLVLHAVSFTVNYLAQPNWALIKLIFAKDRVLKTAEVLQILKYIYYYSYESTLIEKYISKKNLIAVERSELEELLLKADREIFSGSPSKLVDIALSNMGEFTNIGSLSKTRIPLLMFELYLKEKNLHDYWDKLAASLGTDVKQTYEIAELRRIINSPLFVRKEKTENMPDSEPPVSLLGLKDGNSQENDILGHNDEAVSSSAAENEEDTETLEFEAPYIMPSDLVFDEGGDNESDVQAETGAEDTESPEKTERDFSGYSDPGYESFDDSGDDMVISEEDKYASAVENEELIDSGIPDDQPDEGDLTERFILELDEEPSENEKNNDEDRVPALFDESVETDPEADDTDDVVAQIGDDSSGYPELNRDETDTTGVTFSDTEPFARGESQADEFNENEPSGLLPDDIEQVKRDKDVSDFFTDREMRKITSGIFQEDIRGLAQTFDAVSRCRSFFDAEPVLNGLFRERGISPESKTAKILIKNIQKYFQQD